jgi:hypothetical protein
VLTLPRIAASAAALLVSLALEPVLVAGTQGSPVQVAQPLVGAA